MNKENNNALNLLHGEIRQVDALLNLAEEAELGSRITHENWKELLELYQRMKLDLVAQASELNTKKP